MVASHTSHSLYRECDEEAALTEASQSSLYLVKDNTVRAHEKKIVSFNQDVVSIGGTLTVAF
jgi:hypothetical protein